MRAEDVWVQRRVVIKGFREGVGVIMRAWSWFTCFVVVHFGSVVSVGMGEAHGWCEEEKLAHTSINGSNLEVVFC